MTGDLDRWRRTAREPPRWDERNRLLAAFVPPGTSVLDVGAGAQTLRDHLPAGCRYQAVDLVPGPGVQVRDLNAGEYPEPAAPVDLVVCSGVLEYLTDPGALLARLPGLAPGALASYAEWRPHQRRADRDRAGWVNHFTPESFAALLDASGRPWRRLTEWRGQAIVALGAPRLLDPPADQGPPRPDPADEPWERGYRGVAQAAGAPLPAGLRGWVHAQRVAHARGELHPERAARLERLPGWRWTVP